MILVRSYKLGQHIDESIIRIVFAFKSYVLSRQVYSLQVGFSGSLVKMFVEYSLQIRLITGVLEIHYLILHFYLRILRDYSMFSGMNQFQKRRLDDWNDSITSPLQKAKTEGMIVMRRGISSESRTRHNVITAELMTMKRSRCGMRDFA
jgi:hypothetical protein